MASYGIGEEIAYHFAASGANVVANSVTAIQMATLNTAEVLCVDQELGSLAPELAATSYSWAHSPNSRSTAVSGGEIVVEDGDLVTEISQPDYPEWMRETGNHKHDVPPDDFMVESNEDTVTVRPI